MGAKIDVPSDKVAEFKAALQEHGNGSLFGTACEGNHPHTPHKTRLDFEEMPKFKEREFANFCTTFGIEVTFYDTRNKPFKPSFM